MKNKETVSWQDQKASERFAMISPLLADDLDPAKRSQIRSRIAETNSVSERTLYRFEAAWRRDGYSGLRPVNRQMRRSQKLPENFDEIVRQAIQLKKEVPSKSTVWTSLIQTTACKAAIKAHDVITKEEALSLISQLHECRDPYHCAHGRPTFYETFESDIEKKFKRIV